MPLQAVEQHLDHAHDLGPGGFGVAEGLAHDRLHQLVEQLFELWAPVFRELPVVLHADPFGRFTSVPQRIMIDRWLLTLRLSPPQVQPSE